MLDPLSITLLSKALDFILEEGHKIINERRKRKESPPELDNKTSAKPYTQYKLNQSKGGSHKKQIDSFKLEKYKHQIQHLMDLAEIYRKNYEIASKQYAMWGGETLVPEIVVHRRADAEQNLINTLEELKVVLEDIYNTKDLWDEELNQLLDKNKVSMIGPLFCPAMVRL